MNDIFKLSAATAVDEATFFARLQRSRPRGAPDPDYRRAPSYAPQWKVVGSTYYYQLPNDGPVIAVRLQRPGFIAYHFNAEGFERI